MKRFLALLLTIILGVLCFSACSDKTDKKTLTADSEEKNVTVKIEDTINKTLIEGELSLPENCKAGEYLRQLCNEKDVTVTGVDEGYITAVGDVKTDGNYAWMFYINGELSDGGINDYAPKAGDTISLVYLDWTTISFE